MTSEKPTKETIAPVNMTGWTDVKVRLVAQGATNDTIIRAAEDYIEELLGDFEAVKDINRVTSIRYAEFIECLPTVWELDAVIEGYVGRLHTGLYKGADAAPGTHMIVDERVRLLRKLKSAVERLNDTSKEQGAQPDIPTEAQP